MGGGWGGAGVASSMGTFLILSVATVKPKDSCRYCKECFRVLVYSITSVIP